MITYIVRKPFSTEAAISAVVVPSGWWDHVHETTAFMGLLIEYLPLHIHMDAEYDIVFLFHFILWLYKSFRLPTLEVFFFFFGSGWCGNIEKYS